MHTGCRLALLVLLTWLGSCGPGRPPALDPMTDRLQSDLAALEGVRIFFGHQSVGENLLEGLDALQRDSPHRVAVLALDEAGDRPPGFLLHTRVGRNEDPASKCHDFRRILDDLPRGSIDVALLKFCYIDINEQTDVAAMFDAYRSLLDDLARRHPEMTFVPATAPLRHTAGGVGVWIREALGRPNRSKLANIRRNDFNDLVRRTYAGQPLFDIAAAQSTYPDGRRETFVQDGRTYETLIGAYTDDGGHLNAAGRVAVAADLVHSLAEAATARRHRVP